MIWVRRDVILMTSRNDVNKTGGNMSFPTNSHLLVTICCFISQSCPHDEISIYIKEVINVCSIMYGEMEYVIFHRSGREEIRTRMRLFFQCKYACIRTQECDVVARVISNKKTIKIV